MDNIEMDNTEMDNTEIFSIFSIYKYGKPRIM